MAGERIIRQGRALDKFEQERTDFHDRVRQAYLQRAVSAPHRIHLVDAGLSLEDIKKIVEETVTTHCL